MTNRWCHSRLNTHLPLLPCPSFCFRDTLKQADPRSFPLLCSRPFFLPPHQAISLCLSIFFFLSSSHSAGHCIGQDGRHDRPWDCPPHICHSSHPTNDSCLYPLTLSPLHFFRDLTPITPYWRFDFNKYRQLLKQIFSSKYLFVYIPKTNTTKKITTNTRSLHYTNNNHKTVNVQCAIHKHKTKLTDHLPKTMGSFVSLKIMTLNNHLNPYL